MRAYSDSELIKDKLHTQSISLVSFPWRSIHHLIYTGPNFFILFILCPEATLNNKEHKTCSRGSLYTSSPFVPICNVTQLKISPQHWLESSAPFHLPKLRFASSCILLSPHTESKNEIETWQQTWLFRNVYCTWSIFNQRLTLSCQRIVVMRLVQIYVRWTCPS